MFRYGSLGDTAATATGDAAAAAELAERKRVYAYEEDTKKPPVSVVDDLRLPPVTLRTPFHAAVPLSYADFTASGRSCPRIEKYIEQNVLPIYGNTHTLTTHTSRQTTFFRHEARTICKNFFNCCPINDALIFVPNGCTGAVTKFVRVIEESVLCDEPLGDVQDEKWHLERFFREDRWGSVECSLCNCRLKNEAAFRAHVTTPMHVSRCQQANETQTVGDGGSGGGEREEEEKKKERPGKAGKKRVLFLLDPMSHHSSTLPFRELSRKFPGRVDFVENFPGADFEADLVRTARQLAPGYDQVYAVLCAVSNVTGKQRDLDSITRRLHGVPVGAAASSASSATSNVVKVAWDFASVHLTERVDLNPRRDVDAAVDAAFFSPHKWFGGPGASGILVMKKGLMKNRVPTVPGGGNVFFVSAESHSFIQNFEEREEAGTPNILADIRAGLTCHLHNELLDKRTLVRDGAAGDGGESLAAREARYHAQVLTAMRAMDRVEILGDGAGAGHDTSGASLPATSSSGKKKSSGTHGAPIISFMVRASHSARYLHHNFVSVLLNDLFGIQVRGGCACAGPYAHQLLGISKELAVSLEHVLKTLTVEILRPGFVRLSLHWSMTQAEVDLCVAALSWVAERGERLLPLYTFDVETGEWMHRDENFAQNRVWLSSLSLGGSTSEAAGPIAQLEGQLGIGDDRTRRKYDGIAVLPRTFAVQAEGRGSAVRPKEADVPPLRALVDAASAVVVPRKRHAWPVLPPGALPFLWFVLPADMHEVLEAPRAGGCSKPQQEDVPCFQVPGHEYSLGPSPSRATTADSPAGSTSASGASMREGGAADEDELVLSDCEAFEAGCSGDEKEDGSPPRGGAPPHAEKGVASCGFPHEALYPVVSKQLRKLVGSAVADFVMVKPGDRVLIGLSGGKDSLTLLHVLLSLRKSTSYAFEIACATVNPMTPEYDPTPLVPYLRELGVPYHMLSKPIIEMAKDLMNPKKPSICSFCARMKRGMLYTCMRENGYNVLMLGQHLDDLAESFMMSAFHNGALRTMKANYFVQQEDIRVCRPLVYTREKLMSRFAEENKLPLIRDNCPACFSAPKERHRLKLLLAKEEFEFHDLFSNLLNAMRPLIGIDHALQENDPFSGGGMRRADAQPGEDQDAAAEAALTACGVGDRLCERPRKGPAGKNAGGRPETQRMDNMIVS